MCNWGYSYGFTCWCSKLVLFIFLLLNLFKSFYFSTFLNSNNYCICNSLNIRYTINTNFLCTYGLLVPLSIVLPTLLLSSSQYTFAPHCFNWSKHKHFQSLQALPYAWRNWKACDFPKTLFNSTNPPYLKLFNITHNKTQCYDPNKLNPANNIESECIFLFIVVRTYAIRMHRTIQSQKAYIHIYIYIWAIKLRVEIKRVWVNTIWRHW